MLLQLPVVMLLPPRAVAWLPGAGACAYKEVIGRDCPFCGMSSDLRRLLRGVEPKESRAWTNPASPVVLPLVAVALIIRLAVTIVLFVPRLMPGAGGRARAARGRGATILTDPRHKDERLPRACSPRWIAVDVVTSLALITTAVVALVRAA